MFTGSLLVVEEVVAQSCHTKSCPPARCRPLMLYCRWQKRKKDERTKKQMCRKPRAQDERSRTMPHSKPRVSSRHAQGALECAGSQMEPARAPMRRQVDRNVSTKRGHLVLWNTEYCASLGKSLALALNQSFTPLVQCVPQF